LHDRKENERKEKKRNEKLQLKGLDLTHPHTSSFQQMPVLNITERLTFP
jgi:hypothetical protein